DVPGDVSIVGFDDVEVSAHVGLCTVRQHLTESGRVAAEYLLAVLRGDRGAQPRPLPPVELVIRRTTAAFVDQGGRKPSRQTAIG
ncbi:MAG: substrate-binding domain-containing protein, partial [Rhizobiales bacterium]|nr:substrate-binding domain-containing protein [Hyphomicrobiales bacterium]